MSSTWCRSPRPAPPRIGAGAAADPAAALRRRRAVAIVERYANYSAIGGAIPMPLANAAAITALLVRMVKSLSAALRRALRAQPHPLRRHRPDGRRPADGLRDHRDVDDHLCSCRAYNLLGLAVSSVTSAPTPAASASCSSSTSRTARPSISARSSCAERRPVASPGKSPTADQRSVRLLAFGLLCHPLDQALGPHVGPVLIDDIRGRRRGCRTCGRWSSPAAPP